MVKTRQENVIADMQAALHDLGSEMATASWTYGELRHVVVRSELDLWDFPTPFRQLFNAARERADRPEGEGFYVPGLMRTLSDSLKAIILLRESVSVGRHAAPE